MKSSKAVKPIGSVSLIHSMVEGMARTFGSNLTPVVSSTSVFTKSTQHLSQLDTQSIPLIHSLTLTNDCAEAMGIAQDQAWPIIAALWDNHKLTGEWHAGVVKVNVYGISVYVQEILSFADSLLEVEQE